MSVGQFQVPWQFCLQFPVTAGTCKINWSKILERQCVCVLIYTSVACAFGPTSVTTFSTDFSFQKTWFFGIYLNFQRQKSLKNQYLPHSESKSYQIKSIVLIKIFPTTPKAHSNSSEIFSYDLI
jgi:hypothetical protein